MKFNPEEDPDEVWGCGMQSMSEEIGRLENLNADLLAALIEVRDRGCRLRRVDELDQEYVAVPHEEAVESVRAAIKKAEGEA